MSHHESVDGKRRPTTKDFPLPEARSLYFPQGRLYHRLCQVVREPAVQRPKYCSESLGIEK